MTRVIDAVELPPGATIEADVCIVGSGAAGLTLAAELAGSSIDVCIVEAGGWEYEAATQDLYRGDGGGLPYFPLDANRQRSFGGTTNLWAGWCRPLDAGDFRVRAWVPESGWPFGREELLPYYRRAHEHCGLGSFDYDTAAWEARLGVLRLTLSPDEFRTEMFRLTRPTCFVDLYRERIATAPNVRLLLHANVLGLATDEHGVVVESLTAGCLGGRRFAVRADCYVLAAGGIENARLLLLSNGAKPNGIGNDHDLVGRTFMEHAHFRSGIVDLEPGGPRIDLDRCGGEESVGRLFLPEAVQRRETLLACSMMLEPLYRGDETAPARALVRALDVLRRRRHPLRARAARLAREPTRKLPRLGRPLHALRIHHTLEQAPNRASRVLLGDERDAFGARRARLEWHTSDLEERTLARSLELLDAAFRAGRLGRLRPASERRDWPPPPLQGKRGHHMGTTRMSDDPRRGVVDADGRVHGVANLFVAGSSVFPTSGAGTPTLTIVAMAIRLADRIKRAKPRGGETLR